MTSQPGISSISLFFPQHRVDLERWCEWTNTPWAKVEAVVGRGFRVCTHEENVYTMAASAVLRLIVGNRIDPTTVGFLGLGTESSTDNAAGAVIVKGMVDQGLRALGLAPLARDCEVPEFKQACLAGMYALTAAARWLACEPDSTRCAITVSSDIAEYQAGSSGEPTQGAGAVAFQLEAKPRMLELDLAHIGAASSYRGFDFRKPFARHFLAPNGQAGHELPPRDYPVFNGKYSTLCYVDQVQAALDSMLRRLGEPDRREFWRDLAAVFMHRPYHQLPATGLATLLVADLVRDPAGRAELAALAKIAGIELERVVADLDRIHDPAFDLFAEASAHGCDHDPSPALSQVARVFRTTPGFVELVSTKLALGSETAREFGNLYTASLPAWLAAGLVDARQRGLELAGRHLLLLGYGSGDAALAIPARVVPNWQEQVGRIGVERALAGAVDLTREQYEPIHAGRPLASLAAPRGFAIDRVGTESSARLQELGIDYYRFTDTL